MDLRPSICSTGVDRVVVASYRHRHRRNLNLIQELLLWLRRCTTPRDPTVRLKPFTSTPVLRRLILILIPLTPPMVSTDYHPWLYPRMVTGTPLSSTTPAVHPIIRLAVAEPLSISKLSI